MIIPEILTEILPGLTHLNRHQIQAREADELEGGRQINDRNLKPLLDEDWLGSATQDQESQQQEDINSTASSRVLEIHPEAISCIQNYTEKFLECLPPPWMA